MSTEAEAELTLLPRLRPVLELTREKRTEEVPDNLLPLVSLISFKRLRLGLGLGVDPVGGGGRVGRRSVNGVSDWCLTKLPL